MPRKSKILLGIIAVLNLAALLIAAYLAFEHYLKAIPPCTIAGNCEKVLTSQYAAFFGIPVALAGAVYFAAMFIFLLAFLDTKNRKFLTLYFRLGALGFLAAAGFIALQIFVIKAFCIYCVVSDSITMTLPVLAFFIIKFNDP